METNSDHLAGGASCGAQGHTPGPWYANRWNSAQFFVMADRGVVSDVVFESSSIKRREAEANARLIAAAPELLEALDQMLDDIGRDNSMPSAVKARAAIAKATGAA